MKYSSLTSFRLAGVMAASVALAAGAILATPLTYAQDTSASSTMSTTTSASSTPTTNSVHIMVMDHLCSPNVMTLQDFENLSAGKGSVAGLAADVLACPTTALPGNEAASGTVASPRTTYEFTLAQNGTSTKTLSANGMYAPQKLCESDIGVDVNGDGTISSSTCLDISNYDVSGFASSSPITVTESTPSAGYHFGTLLFTPPQLAPNNDSQSLVSTNASGTITLDPSKDTDGMIMLHVYNFLNATTSATSTGGGTVSTTTSTTTDIGFLQGEINTLQNAVVYLEAQILALIGISGGTGTTTGGMPPPSQSSAQIDQNGATMSAGSSIDFSGRNFGHEESVTITLNGNAVATAHADGGGNFSTGSIAGPKTPGTYTYTFTGQNSGDQATATITAK